MRIPQIFAGISVTETLEKPLKILSLLGEMSGGNPGEVTRRITERNPKESSEGIA